MELNVATYDYWQQACLQEILHNLTPELVQSNWFKITQDECLSGKISNQSILEPLLMAGSTIVIVPFIAKREHKYFFPCMLLADLNPVGRFIAKPYLSLPVIPRTILEPSMQTAVTLGFAENFENYIAVHAPVWQEDDQLLNWTEQLSYAEHMLNEVTPEWRNELANAGFEMQHGAMVFSLNTLQKHNGKMNIDLLDKPGKINLIDSERNSGKSTYAKQLIINAWVEAAVKLMDPPKFVWLQPDAALHYADIFSIVGNINPSEDFVGHKDAHAKLVDEYNIYTQGQHLIRNWREMSKRIEEKYFDKGGIEARKLQLETNLKEIKAQKRHLEVLLSIWIRQKELVVAWSQAFDFIPLLQNQRLRRLYSFFKQNFPEENVVGLNLKQLDTLMQEKAARIENSERVIADTLHQVENDLYQENLIREKCLQWCASSQINTQNIQDIQTLLQGQMWNKLVTSAVCFWQQDFAAKQGHANFLDKAPDEIDLLLVEHAEYISPMQAAQLLAISKRAVIMGNYNAICNPRYSTQIDYELTKYFALTECDADFEDLQFDGILGSVGNLWSLATKDKEADQIFTQFPRPALQYEYIDVQTPSQISFGSRINAGVTDVVLDWLRKHATLRNEITIYTCFGGQAMMLKNALASTEFAKVPIRLIQEPHFNKSVISLFIPVYTKHDAGPFVFDRGAEMLDQLITNTLERLIVIGDLSIFKPELHSAAGKFAKALFAKSGMDITNILKEQEEVICV
jgi:hypothetical protein